MGRRKLPYQEGTWFAVPLEKGGYGTGVVARLSGKGAVFGYFFGPRRASVPSYEEVSDLRPRDAIWLERFGDLGLIRKQWPIIGQTPDWRREKWPLPPFGRVDDDDEVPPKAWKVIYNDNLELLSEEPCKPSLARKYPEDGLAGAGYVELYLTDLLDKGLKGSKG